MKPLLMLLAAAILAMASPVAAQLSVSLRGGAGLPTGSFASNDQDEIIRGAKTGFGYGLDAALGFTRFLALYAGFDRVAFECEDSACGTDGEYTVAGVTGGVKLSPFQMGSIAPWIKGGVTFNELQGEYGGTSQSSLATDRAPGYEVGAGLDIPLFGIMALSPRVRFIGQNFKYKIPGVTSPDPDDTETIGYFVADLGFGFRTPFGGRN